MEGLKAAVVTVSDSAWEGQRSEDASGDNAAEKLRQLGCDITRYVVKDDREQIAETFVRIAQDGISLIVSTGGTGLGPRDVTPEATRDIIDKEIPGMAEAMRMQTLKNTPFAMTARQVVGVRNQTLIVNLPGSPKAVGECLDVVLPVIPHVLNLIRGNTRH